MSRVLLSVLICCCYSQLVTSQGAHASKNIVSVCIQIIMMFYSVIIQPPQNQSVCEQETVHFTCVVMFASGAALGSASWFTDNGNVDALTLQGYIATNDVNERLAPANITNVLTVTNVSISDNGRDYICAQGFGISSDAVFLTVLGELMKFTYKIIV